MIYKSNILFITSFLILLVQVNTQANTITIGSNKTKPEIKLDLQPNNIVYSKPGHCKIQSDDPVQVQFILNQEASDPWEVVPSDLEDPVIDTNECHLGRIWVNQRDGQFLYDEEYRIANITYTSSPSGGGSPHGSFWVIEGTISVKIVYHGYKWVEEDYKLISGEFIESVNFYIEIDFERFTSYEWYCDGNTLNAMAWKHRIDSQGLLEMIPWEGVSVTPDSPKMSFSPNTTTTTYNPNVGNEGSVVAVFQCITPLNSVIKSSSSMHSSKDKPELTTSSLCSRNEIAGATVELTMGDVALPPKEVPLFFAEVLNVHGQVEMTDPLSGEVSSVSPGMRLAPGVRLKGTKFTTAWGTVIYPSIRLRFCNGVTEEIDLVDFNGQHLSVLLGKAGTDSVDKRASRFEIMLSELEYQIQHEPRQLASHIVSKAFGHLAGTFSGGWSMIVGKGTEIVVQEYYNSQQLRDQSPLNFSFPYQSSAEVMSQSSILGSRADCGPGQEYTWRLYDDGSFSFDNPGPSLILSTSDGHEYMVPSGASRMFNQDQDYEPDAPQAMADPAHYANELSISPSPGEIVSRQPTIIISSEYPLKKGTLACWVNGFNIAPYIQMYPQYQGHTLTNQATYIIPPEMRLPQGENTIEFRGKDTSGQVFRTFSTFTAKGELQSPKGISILEGQNTIVLRWEASRERDLAGYRLYRSDDKHGLYTYIGTSTQPVFAHTDPDGGNNWYKVSAFDKENRESDLSLPISGLLRNHPLPVSSKAPSITATPLNKAIKLNISSPSSPTACWMLERSKNKGPFESLISGQELFYTSSYIDTEVTPESYYRYRLIALNADLQPGSSTTTNSIEPLDLSPSPPFGVAVDYIKDQARIRWNSSPDKVIGYRLFIQEDNGSYEDYGDLLSGNQIFLPVTKSHVYHFALCAVDNQNRMGKWSIPVELSTWRNVHGVKYGSLQIFIQPKEAVAAGAKWRRAGTSLWYSSGETEVDVPLGEYIVEFKEIDGWRVVDDIHVCVQAYMTKTHYGSYEIQSKILPGVMMLLLEE